MNIPIPNKLTGDSFEAPEFNTIKDAVNVKADQSDLTIGLTLKVDKTTYTTDLAALNDSNTVIRDNLTVLNNAPAVDLTPFLTITGATLTYQPKGSYLVQSDITNKFLPSGTTLFSGSYLDLANKPAIPNLTGYATESFVTGKGYATQGYVASRGYLTAVSWPDITGKPSIFNGDYNSLINKPTIPSITGLESGLLTKVDKTTYTTDLAALNDSNSAIRDNLTILNNVAPIDLTPFLTITGATLNYQPKGSYLVAADIQNKFLPLGTNLFSGSYLDLTNRPNIPNLTGYATESFVTGKGYATQGYVTSRGYLTAVSWSDVTGKPSFFNGDYNILINKPNLDIYATESFVRAKGYLTAVSWSDVSGKPSFFNGDYNNLVNKPTIPNLNGYATQDFVTSKGYLTTVNWNDIIGKPTTTGGGGTSNFSGSYLDLTNKPTIPSIAGLATTSYVDNSFSTATGLTTATINTAFNANKIYFGTGFTGAGTSASPINPIAGSSNSTGSTTVDFSVIRGGYPNSMQTLYNLIIANQGAIQDLQANGGGGTGTGTTTLNRPVISFGTSSATQNIINWTASTNATSYSLDRSSDNVTFTNIYTGSLLTFTDIGRISSTLYYYRLKASGAGFTDSQYAIANKATASSGTLTPLSIDPAAKGTGVTRSGNTMTGSKAGEGAMFLLKAAVGSTTKVRADISGTNGGSLILAENQYTSNATFGYASRIASDNTVLTIYKVGDANPEYDNAGGVHTGTVIVEHRTLMIGSVWTIQTWMSLDNSVSFVKIREDSAGVNDLRLKVFFDNANTSVRNIQYDNLIPV